MKYIVTRYEVWEQPVEVEASDADDALWRVSHDEGKVIDDLFAHSHDLSVNDWKVEEPGGLRLPAA
jgi:hypothetical protein